MSTTADPAPVSALSGVYDPEAVEPRLAAWWEERGFYRADPAADGEPFAIAMPPPNVTGVLHLGHALTAAIEDALVRHARMQGRNAVWLPGTDHAGIATQAVVERRLAAEGTSRAELGREAFTERVWRWREQSGGRILQQTRRLGASCDWDREAFTLDEPRAAAVREVFCRLYDEGLVYRGTRLVNWDPALQTALSDIEVTHETVEGELAHLRYPSPDGGPGVVVATTRPETMLGDTAVAVHPDDERYAALVGRTVVLPLLDREIPVVADDHVDPAFGTGAVKVTPAHDPNDHAIGLRHELDVVDVLTDDGHVNEHGGPYAGLDRFAARAQVLADLDVRGLLVGVEPHSHSVGHSSRSGVPVEPRLSEQWFVATRPLADAAARAVRDGEVRFVPQRNAKGFLDWLDKLHDWCISRQIWWGHRIPAWYDRDGNVEVRRDDPTPQEVQARGLVRDPDVLDTWFSSQLWPFTTLGWTGGGRDQTPDLATWYPNAVMETGYDINTFWVSRMLMIGLHVLGEVPFKVVFNHGMVRDEHGKKMSKSSGNVIDPLDLVEAYGADALRFALLRASSPGVDVPIATEWVEGARRFVNKLWNAGRFVLGTVGGTAFSADPPTDLRLEDRWVLSRLERVRAEVDDAYEAFDTARVVRALYHFVWDEYCDWYLELAKLRDDEAARHVLATVLDAVLRLLHPVIPFVTEELWRALHRADDDTALIRAAWPSPRPEDRDDEAEAGMAALQEAVVALRRFRADHGLARTARLDVVVVAGQARRAALDSGVEALRRLAGVDGWTAADAAPDGVPVGRLVLADAELLVGLEGLVDLDSERARLDGEIEKAQAEVTRAQGKLANERFVARAPADLVQSERDKLAQWQEAAAQLHAQRVLLGASS